MQTELFDDISNTWWDEKGPYKALHWLTPLRMQYISQILSLFPSAKILDVGCGGGLMSLPLARQGYQVWGVDQTPGSIETAKAKSDAENLNIMFYTDLKDLGDEKFNLILLLEVLEHVRSPESLLSDLKKYLYPGGKIIISTLNRTIMSYLLGIVVAEKILKWAPEGIHEWKDFIKPSELIFMLKRQGFEAISLQGYEYSIFSNEWKFCEALNINYFLTAELI